MTKKIFMVMTLTWVGTVALNAATIADGSFLNWTFSSSGTATVTRETTAGNPAARLNVTTVTGVSAYGIAVNNNFTTNDALSGAFSLGLDVLSGPGAFGQGQTIWLAVQQGQDIYGQWLGITQFPRNFDTVLFQGTFDASQFNHFLGNGATLPDFAGGTATSFGFMAENQSSGTLTQYYDNFTLDYGSSSPEAPEPSTLLLGATGAVFIEWLRRRRMS